MRFSPCLAASFALLTVIITPITAYAQSQPRLLTPEETIFVRAFDEAMKTTNNRIARETSDLTKVAHGQSICSAFKSGSPIQSVNSKLVEYALKIEDEAFREEFRQYVSGIVVIATRNLCPKYSPMLKHYLESP